MGPAELERQSSRGQHRRNWPAYTVISFIYNSSNFSAESVDGLQKQDPTAGKGLQNSGRQLNNTSSSNDYDYWP